jgi:hypothetical protein
MKRSLLRDAESALEDVRLIGDCIVACFFSADNDRDRKRTLAAWQVRVESWLAGGPGRSEVSAFVRATLGAGPKRIPCFHWEVEFPEVFSEARS